MNDEIDRILSMVKDGTLTPEQATEMIGALREASRANSQEPQPDSAPREEAASTSRSDRGQGHRHRHRRRHGHRGFERVFDDLGDDIERAMGAGARTLRWALKSGLHLKGSVWGDDTNSAVLSRADSPVGHDFVCEANDLAVSHLRDLRLNRSTFSRNELNAASMQDIELNDSRVTGQRLRGSSIKGALIENGELADNDFNGAGVVSLTVGKGHLNGSKFNGTQIRDLGISASGVENCRFNGTKLKTVVVRTESIVKALSLNGVLGRNWLFEDAVVADTHISGLRVDGLVLKSSGLERVTFKKTEWSEHMDPSALGLIRDVEMQRVILKDCRFEDCRFDGTRLEGFDASNLTFKNVDFSNLVIKTAEDFARLAGERHVA